MTFDPVHQDDAGWWFYDETWADRHGPYACEKTARRELYAYDEIVLEGPKTFMVVFEYRQRKRWQLVIEGTFNDAASAVQRDNPGSTIMSITRLGRAADYPSEEKKTIDG